MEERFIARQVQRTNRNLLVVNVLLTVAVAAVAIGNVDYIRAVLMSPTAVDGARLGAISRPGAPGTPRYVTVTAEAGHVYPAGEEVSSRGRVTARYLVARVDDRLLVVKTRNDDLAIRFSGSLEPIPFDVRSNVIQDARASAQVRAMFLPFMLDGTSSVRGSGGYLWLAAGALLGLLGLWNVLRALRRMSGSATHPILRDLERWGNAETVAGEIDNEIVFGGNASIKKTLVTRSWLLSRFMFGLHVRRLSDLVWMHGHVTRHYHNGIPTGRTFKVVVYDRNGKTTDLIVRKEKQTEEIMAAIHERAPWVIAGFDENISSAWRRDRASLIAAVDQRRRDAGQRVA